MQGGTWERISEDLVRKDELILYARLQGKERRGFLFQTTLRSRFRATTCPVQGVPNSGQWLPHAFIGVQRVANENPQPPPGHVNRHLSVNS